VTQIYFHINHVKSYEQKNVDLHSKN